MLSPLMFLALAGCKGDPALDSDPPDTRPQVPAAHLDGLDPAAMKRHVDFLADDARGGRIPGSFGHREARDYIIDEMTAIGLEPVGTEGYIFPYDNYGSPNRFQIEPDGSIVRNAAGTGQALLGFLPGSDPERADEIMLFIAHYDHLGVAENGDVFSGAFDNAGGVAALLEVARTFAENGAPPRSILFMISDDEESGLLSPEKWMDNPTLPRDGVLFGISADPLGRPHLPDHWPLVFLGTERSPALHAKFDENRWFWREKILPRFTPAGEDPPSGDVWLIDRSLVSTFHSDQDPLFARGLAGAWMTNIGFAWYHTVDDKPATIDYRVLSADAMFLAHMVWILGNDTGTYSYDGAPPSGAVAAREMQGLIDGSLASEVLTEAERERLTGMRADLQLAVDADSFEAVPDSDNLVFGSLFYLLFILNGAHPGPVPPPFPEN